MTSEMDRTTTGKKEELKNLRIFIKSRKTGCFLEIFDAVDLWASPYDLAYKLVVKNLS